METIIISAILTILVLYFIKKKQTSDYGGGSIQKLTDKVYLMPNGDILDLNHKGLSLEHEFHNMAAEREEKWIEIKYQIDLAQAEEEKRLKQWLLMMDKVKLIPVDEKVELLSKWIDYMVDWHLKEKNQWEKEIGYMNFDFFMASQIIPFKSYGMKFVFKQPLSAEYCIRYIH